MKKGLLFTFLLVFVSVCSGWGQWEKVTMNNLNSGVYYQESFNLTVYKDTIITSKSIQKGSTSILVFYFSTDFGKKWKRLNMPDNTSFSWTDNQICMNKLGLFYLQTTPNVKTTIYHSTNFGRSWSDTTIFHPDRSYSKMENYDTIMYLRLGRSVGSPDGYKRIYTYNSNKWSLYGDVSTITENRVVSDSTSFDKTFAVISDVSTKARLASIKVGDKGYSLENPITFAKDSIVVVRKRKDGFTIVISVTPDLGKTWNDKELKVVDGRLDEVLFDKNKIYINTGYYVFASSDFGKTWENFDKDISFGGRLSSTSNNSFKSLILIDSNFFLLNNGYLFVKKQNSNWEFARNYSESLEDLTKVSDSLYWARNGRVYLISKNKGVTWDYHHFTFNDKEISYLPLSLNGNLYSYQDELHRSSDLGKSWIKDSSVLRFYIYSKPLIFNDSIIFKTPGFVPVQLSVKPYINLQSLVNTDSLQAPFSYSDNYIYGVYGDNFTSRSVARYNIKTKKIEYIRRETNLSGSLGKIISYKNKVWIKEFGNTLYYSNNYGDTWEKYNLPEDTDGLIYSYRDLLILNTKKITSISNFSNYSTVGVYVSANNGKSWTLFTNGLKFINNSFLTNDPVFSSESIDSILFLKCYQHGIYRLDMKAIQLQNITGNVFMDKNKNGIKDIGENGYSNAKVFISNIGAFTTTDELGNYNLLADLKATDTLKASVDSKYATYTPQYLLVSQSDTDKNIGVFIPANLQDLVVNGTAITPPRSGFTNSYLLTYKNAGAITKSGKVTFNYNAKQTYIEATQAPTSNVNNTLSWDYANLQPNETRTLKVTFKTAADVPIRTQLTNVATIEPIATDTFKTDNVDSLFQIVVGSYDPNDKQVSFLNTRQTPSVIDPNTEMTYTIRFQNTGNYQADFVRVTDTLSDKLDLTTLRVLATSHNYTLSVKNKNVLQFEFNPIYLPDSTTNEKESHGFIKFAIKPKKTLTKDEVIKNTAYIFFDYNPAIITNTVETANQKVNGLFTPSVLESLSVFPNPTNGEISFSLNKFQGKALSINVYSIDGKLMINKHTVGEAVNRINGEGLRNGLYVLQVRVGDEVVFGRFMVQK
jgi:uncharacterized repeat protein (TIGR01451 family)